MWNIARINWFEYSVDGVEFTSFGDAYQLGWGKYRGDRIGLYSYNCESEQGYIEVDQFGLQIEAWCENSLRIRSRMMGEILDTDPGTNFLLQ